MKPLHRLLNFLFIGILLLACEDEQQTWLSEMEGTPDCTVPAVIGKSLPVTIAAVGIITPSNVAYTWHAPKFSPETFTGTTFEAIAPPTAGEYPIIITAHSAGYRDITIKKKITVLNCVPMQGHLDIVVPTDVVIGGTVRFIATGITSPAEENVTYQWITSDFKSDSYTGDIFEAKAPSQDGAYTITVIAKAENYCNTPSDTTITVVLGRKMQGGVRIEALQDAMAGEEITFTAQGIIEPSTGITYTWTTPLFEEVTQSGNSYTAICPDNPETYTVSVRASATGYADSTAKKEITVHPKDAMKGDISITVLPAAEVSTSQTVTFHVSNGITTPAEGVSFVWDAPGFTPDTHTGNTFTATAPATAGSPTVTVKASAAKYSSTTATTTVTVKEGKDMTGTLDFDIPSKIAKDLEATFSIKNNSLTAGTSSITYEWDAPGFNPATFSGPTFTGIPTITGQRTVTLYAKAEGYTTVSTSKTVDVIEGLDMGTLTISATNDPPFNAGINTVTFTPQLTSSPTSSITYTWNATGCTPDSFTGNQYNPTLPSEVGNYEIKLTAQATGYLPKTASFTYTIACKPMTVDFNLSRTELLINDETTLSVNSPGTDDGTSYTWTIPSGFGVPDDLTTPSITIKAPSTGLVNPATLTLTAKAVNYCDATHTATVTVKECYPSTYTPVINSSATFENGMFHASNLQNITFSTLPVAPLRGGGSVTYKWWFDPNSGGSFTPSSHSSAANDDNTFNTKAPVYNNNATYTLNLQVAAEGYCPLPSASKKVVVIGSAGQLQGTVEILEVVAPTNPVSSPEMWMVQDRPATLTARYNGPEPKEQLNLQYKWYWEDGPTSVFLEENDGRLYYTPSREISNGTVRVEVYDLNGKAHVYKDYPLTVKYCAASSLPGLYANVNYPCGNTKGFASAFVKDESDRQIYEVRLLPNDDDDNNLDKWWFIENLRANKQHNATITYLDVYGAYYPASEKVITALGTADGKYCPEGWRIPSKEEWTALNNSISKSSNGTVFQKLATSDKAANPVVPSTAWNSSIVNNLPDFGENNRDFNLIPAGSYNGSSFSVTGTAARFLMRGGSYIQQYGHTSSEINPGIASQTGFNDNHFYTVRCVND